VKDLFGEVFPHYDVSTASGALDAAISLIRGLGGMVKVGAPLLSGKVPGDRGTLTRKLKAALLKPVTKMGGFLKKHAGWVTIAQFEIIVGGIIDEFVLRGADLREPYQTALHATNTAPRSAHPAALRTARRRPKLPKLLPSVELSTISRRSTASPTPFAARTRPGTRPRWPRSSPRTTPCSTRSTPSTTGRPWRSRC
jgi:hypothetical protein